MSKVYLPFALNVIKGLSFLRRLAKWACVYGGVLAGAALLRMYSSTWSNNLVHQIRQRFISISIERISTAGFLRTQFQQQLELIRTRVRPGHSHEKAAAERNSATETMLAAVRQSGYIPYVISPSPRESNEDGSRAFYGLADMRQQFRHDPITPNHVFVMTDVDYYVDMPALLSHGNPVVAYTFTPQEVSGTVNDGYFTITDNIVHYRVAGGKDVKHPIWNYNQDTVYSCNPLTGFKESFAYYATELSGFGFLRRLLHHITGLFPGGRICTISTIDQFSIGPHRNIVTIVPCARGCEDLVPYEKFGARLERMRYRQENDSVPNLQGEVPVFNVLRFIAPEGPMLSLGVEGQLASLTAPLADVESLIVAHRQTKTANLSDTVRRSKLNDRQAALLHYFITSTVSTKSQEVHKPGQLAKHYQATGVDEVSTLEQGKEYAIAYAPGPLTQEAVYPTESLANEVATVRGRIDEPQRAAKRRENIKPKHYRYAADFVKRVVGDQAGLGQPYSASHVEEQQQKPLQRARNEQGRMHNDYNMSVKSFQKREAYNAPNHPRNISTVPHNHNVKLSGFTYAFKDACLKRTNWYMPCHTPEEIADAVVRLAAISEELVETDYSRFDGTFLRFVREHVEFACYKSWAHPEHRQELTMLLNNELNSKAKTASGMKYDPDCSRLSGSPLTTDGNSLCNAFVSYVASRESNMDADEAYMDIGLAYGDDGLRSGRVTDGVLARAAADLGFDLRVCNRAIRGRPVSFLSRVFADAWSSPASIQSPLRTLLKLHTSVDSTNAPAQVGLSKTTAYLVTDGQTPFISDWCKAYQRNCVEELKEQLVADVPYWVVNDNDVAHPWPQDDSAVWIDIVAADLGKTASEVTDHITLLREYNGPIESLPRLETSVNLQPKITVVLDGEVHAGPIEPKPENGAAKARTQAGSGENSKSVFKSRPSNAAGGRSPAGGQKRANNTSYKQQSSNNKASRPAGPHHQNGPSRTKPKN